MATQTANTRDFVMALKAMTTQMKEQTRILAAVNENLVQLGRILKEQKETSDGQE